MGAFYHTIGKPGEAQLVERRSRFIGRAFAVSSPQEAQKALEEIRRRDREAKHHVYAYCLGREGFCRYTDDGEPKGTAGLPVLNMLQGAGLTDSMIVVTRYFGGVLLGTGGLSRAYSAAAKLALQAASVVEMRLCKRAVLRLSYPQLENVKKQIQAAGGKIETVEYAADVLVRFVVDADRFSKLWMVLEEQEAGTLFWLSEEETHCPLSSLEG